MRIGGVKPPLLNMNLYIDIETLPCDDAQFIMDINVEASQECIKELDAVTAPANYKDPAKIEEYINAKRESIKAERDKKIADTIAKTSFNGLYGSIACICWSYDDSEVFHASTQGTGEKSMIEFFYDDVREALRSTTHGGQGHKQIKVIGHNCTEFDLPFLKHRSIILGVKPQPDIYAAMNAKPWDSCLGDTMTLWSTDKQKRVSLDKLSRALGLGGKGDFDGSMVAETWANGEYAKVIDYCKQDVQLTRAVYKRLTFGG